MQAHLFNARNGGSPQNPDIYNALRQAVFAIQPDDHRILSGHGDDVRAIAFDPNQDALFSASDDGDIRRWPLHADHSELIGTSPNRMQALVLSRDGQRLAAGDSEGNLWLWNFATETDDFKKAQAATGITALAFSNGDNAIAGGHLNGSISLWSLPSLDTPIAVPATTRAHAQTQPVAFPGFTLVWAGETGLHLWNPHADKTPQSLGATLGAATALTASSNSIAAGMDNGDIAVWRQNDLQNPVHFIGHASKITALAFSPDGELLASGSLDNTVKIWHLLAPEDEPISIDHGAWVWSVAFDPAGERLASAGADRTVRLWPTRTDRMAESLCQQLSRDLSASEWQKYIGADIPHERTCTTLVNPMSQTPSPPGIQQRAESLETSRTLHASEND